MPQRVVPVSDAGHNALTRLRTTSGLPAGLLTDGGFVNLATNDTTPLRIDPATWRRIQKRTKSKTTLTNKSPAGNETVSPAGSR